MFKKPDAFLCTCNIPLENKYAKETQTVKNLGIALTKTTYDVHEQNLKKNIKKRLE